MATAKKKATERPYTVDEMAQIGNILSAAKMPADVAKADDPVTVAGPAAVV